MNKDDANLLNYIFHTLMKMRMAMLMMMVVNYVFANKVSDQRENRLVIFWFF